MFTVDCRVRFDGIVTNEDGLRPTLKVREENVPGFLPPELEGHHVVFDFIDNHSGFEPVAGNRSQPYRRRISIPT
jgi:hypothetical protein